MTRTSKESSTKEITMLKGILFLVGLLMVGCSNSPEFKTSGLDASELAIAQSVADDWCEKTGGDYCPRVTNSSDADSVIVKVKDITEDGVSTEDVGARTFRHCNSLGSCSYRIEIHHYDDAKFRRLLLHEMGHASGHQGHLSKGNVMYGQDLEEVDQLTDADADYASE